MERFAIKIDKNLKTHLYKICRLCGIDNPEKIKVLDDETIVSLEDGEPELWKKVLDCIGLLITKDDKMPQFMCTLCVDKINDFFEFREMCYATDGQTRKLLGINDEPKLKASTRSVDWKTEDIDIKQPVSFTQRTGRKRRNADMDICNAAVEIKIDQLDDVKPATTIAGTSASKKKRLKVNSPETETKQEPDVKPGPSVKSVLSGKIGAAFKLGNAGSVSKLGLTKKSLKIEPATKKEEKLSKISKLTKKKSKAESPSAVEFLEEQKKKKTLDLLKQRKLAKRVAVVKVEKLRKGSVDTKIKEETPGTAPAPPPPPPQPKVKLKDKCSICNECFVNKTLLDKHIKVTHIPSIVRYHCVQCNETLKKNMEIKNHNLWHKLSKTPFQCGNCAESACSIYTYSKHIRDCNQVAYLDAHIPDWHCPECSGVFETTYLFNIHSCVSNKLVCPGCDRSHKWKEDYLKHIPACPSAVHRIPEYMSSNVQVKNEAEHPSSPVPPIHTLASSTPLQTTPSSRVTPPLMDSNQCVVIPANVALLDEATSSPSKSTGKKSKRITKKDLKRFDELLKSTMTTLVSIKQEPPQGGPTADGDQLKSRDVEAESESPPGSPPESVPCSPLPGEDDFHHFDDDDDESAGEQTSSTQRVGTIKQEIIDEGYRDLYNNIEVNIKREVTLNQNRNIEASTTPIAPKPVLKLKITKEHGTLNSVLLDSPKSEKKKKKKKRKEEKLKAAESREEANASRDVPVEASEPTNTSDVPDASHVQVNVDQAELIEEEPPMPLPEIICIKQENADSEDGETEIRLSIHSSHSIPSIVAATSGSLQISCVSEGVHFNGADENAHDEDLNESEEPLLGGETPNSDEQQEEIDIKPRLEELIPMLRIASVSSGEDLIKKSVKPAAKRKRKADTTKASTSTPKIISVSSGSAAVAYQHELEKTLEEAEEGEESCEKVDNNENIFDFTQVTIKEEVIDTTYEGGVLPQGDEAEEEEVENEDENDDGNDEEDLENISGEAQCSVTKKQDEENAYIANIDFTNLNIKQEKEYIDDGLDNAAPCEESDNSDTESESSSDAEDNDSESEREYRDLPMEDNDHESNAVDAPLNLQISAVHSEFAERNSNEKTESNGRVSERFVDKPLSNSPTKTSERGETKISDKLTSCKVYIKTPVEEEPSCDSKLEDLLDQPSTSTAKNLEQEVASVSTRGMLTQHSDTKSAEFVIVPSCATEEKPFELKASTSEAVDFIASMAFTLPSETSTSAVADGIKDASHRTFDHVSSISNKHAIINDNLDQIRIASSCQETSHKTIAANKVSSVPTQDLLKCDSDANSRKAGSLTNKSEFNLDGSTIFSTFQDFGDSLSSSQGSSDATNQLQAPPPLVPDVACLSVTNQVVSNTDARKIAHDTQLTRTNIALDVINKFIDQSSLSHFNTLSTTIPDRNVSAAINNYADDDITMGVVEPINRFADESPTLLLRQIDEFTKTDAGTSAPEVVAPPETKDLSDSPAGSSNQIALVPSVERVTNSSLFSAPAASPAKRNEQDISCQLIKPSIERLINFTQMKQHHNMPHESLATHCIGQNSPPQGSSVFAGSHHSEAPAEINLTNVLSSAVLQQTPVPYTHTGNTHEFRETVASYISYADRSIHLTELCSSSSSLSTEFPVNFATPTASHLHSQIPPTNTVQPQQSSDFSLTTNTDLNLRVPELSEEVQNLLNEDTVAVNRFQLNESVLRARCSTFPQSPAVAVSVPNFIDFENVNEIAENNNNANIERELQDELGNVLAAAIADRSPNDEAEDNNVMNENRANFDLT